MSAATSVSPERVPSRMAAATSTDLPNIQTGRQVNPIYPSLAKDVTAFQVRSAGHVRLQNSPRSGNYADLSNTSFPDRKMKA